MSEWWFIKPSAPNRSLGGSSVKKISHESVHLAIWWLDDLMISKRGLNNRPNEEWVQLFSSLQSPASLLWSSLQCNNHCFLGCKVLLWTTWATSGTMHEFIFPHHSETALINPDPFTCLRVICPEKQRPSRDHQGFVQTDDDCLKTCRI